MTKKFKDILEAEWSKTGNKIVFTADSKLYVMSSNGEELKRIVSGVSSPDIHPNGKKVILVRMRKNLPVCEIDLTGGNLKLLERKTFNTDDL